MSTGKQSRKGQAERRQRIIDYIRENGPVKSGQLCKDLGLSRSSLSDDINAINAVSDEIVFPKRGYYAIREGKKASVPLRGMLDAEHIRRWMILRLLTVKDRSFEELAEELPKTGLVCSDSTLHNGLRILKEQGYITSHRTGSLEVYQPVSLVYGASKHQVEQFLNRTVKYGSASRMFYESYGTLYRKVVHLDAGGKNIAATGKVLRLTGKRNILSEEQIRQISNLERYDYRNYALDLLFHTARGNEQKEILRVGIILYSVETNRIYLVGKNDKDLLTVVPLDSVYHNQLSIACIDGHPVLNHIYNTREFTKLKREMLNITPEAPRNVRVRFSQLRSIRDRLQRFQAVRIADKNPAVLTTSEDGRELIYTDCIRGLGDFARFVRRFGRAAIVEEPASLRNMMIETSRKVISLYEPNQEDMLSCSASEEHDNSFAPDPMPEKVTLDETDVINPVSVHTTCLDDYDLRIYDRISELFSLLMNPEFDASVNSISTITETSCAQTKEDLKNLASAGIVLWPSDFLPQLSAGSFADTEIIGLETELPGEDIFLSPYLMFLTPLEKSLFEKGILRGFDIKDSPLAISPEIMERKEIIEQAIKMGIYVRFRYPIPGTTRSENVDVAPRMLLHNTTDDLLYCITFTDNGQIIPFRLDRMRFSVRLVPEKKVPEIPKDDSRYQRLTYIWGSDFADAESPVHVKIRISANTTNILRKIRSDISGRKYAKLYREKDFWIYEDEIIGQSSFRAWLMLFGSSVKVMEPASMAEQIRCSSEQRIRNYEEGRFIW